jgi:hypothetical protein
MQYRYICRFVAQYELAIAIVESANYHHEAIAYLQKLADMKDISTVGQARLNKCRMVVTDINKEWRNLARDWYKLEEEGQKSQDLWKGIHQ